MPEDAPPAPQAAMQAAAPAPAPAASRAGDGPLLALLGKPIVIDTPTPLLYLGTLTEVTPHFLVLTDADVHDMGEGRSTKERYVLEAVHGGIRKNRDEVLVRRDAVISVSALDRVTVY